MNEYRYEIYYKYDGPSHSQPFVQRKTENQVREALSDFGKIIAPYLDDRKANLKIEPIKGETDRVNFILNTTDSEEFVENAIIKTCQYLDLRAQRK